jgi:hypothetical protein
LFSTDGEKIYCRDVHDQAKVLSASTGEFIHECQGAGDLAALATGSSRYPWRAIVRGQETIIESATTGEEIAWFPAPLQKIASDPSGYLWSGAYRNQVFIIKLEHLTDLQIS